MTELMWEGKYDKDGRKVAPLRVALPFQTIETVNESAQERQRTLDLFSRGRDTEWRNRLIWGDKRYVLPALAAEFGGKVNLVYIDPPFASGQDFTLPVSVNGEDFVKQPSMIEVKAYRDTWGKGLESYLQWLYEALILLQELLAENGSIYVHLDWHVGHYAKMLMDEIFGIANFRNEIIWFYRKLARSASQFPKSHDDLLFYTKGTHNTFNIQHVGLSASTLKRWGDRQRGGKDPRNRYATDEASLGAVMPDVWDIPLPIGANPQKTGYPTQKPETLLERIITASSDPGDLVLDCFAGSGTTAVVSERLGRRWIAADLSRFAIHTTRKRLLAEPNLSPFEVQNLGKYERQMWQTVEFGAEQQARGVAYRRFVLDVYRAKPIDGYVWLHGVKDGRMVHVGSVDAPVTVGDVKQIASEFSRAVGTGVDAPSVKAVDVLGWDFAFEMNEVARQTAGRAGIDVRFWRIPREVLDKRAVEQGDVRFFELAALGVAVERDVHTLTVRLTDFVIPMDDVPDAVRQAITEWWQWIDYWAIDWNNKADAFHNEWQSYRTKDEPALQKYARHEYNSTGTYQVVVKVIDILGNDTTKTITVEVA